MCPLSRIYPVARGCHYEVGVRDFPLLHRPYFQLHFELCIGIIWITGWGFFCVEIILGWRLFWLNHLIKINCM